MPVTSTFGLQDPSLGMVAAVKSWRVRRANARAPVAPKVVSRPRGVCVAVRGKSPSRFGNRPLSMRAAALVALVALARADLLQRPGDMHVSGDLSVAGALEARSPCPRALPRPRAVCSEAWCAARAGEEYQLEAPRGGRLDLRVAHAYYILPARHVRQGAPSAVARARVPPAATPLSVCRSQCPSPGRRWVSWWQRRSRLRRAYSPSRAISA